MSSVGGLFKDQRIALCSLTLKVLSIHFTKFAVQKFLLFFEHLLYVRNGARNGRERILSPGTDWLVEQNAVEQIITSQCNKCFDRGVVRCYSL